MEKPKRKFHMILVAAVIVFVIIFINSSLGGIGGEKEQKKESRELAALEETLMQIEGIGDIQLYFHYKNGESADPLSDYFSPATASSKKGNDLQGILVVAEGAGDLKIQSRLSSILSTVLQLPEHRIVIVEMKKRGNTNENE
ncbi:hypothetical protein [Sporosarcina sp. HYO08]|uniref:hypothetical protein n=1 Tax=Sporosarcina sp. HYO08 TaxID=1759557 RepID=UPI000799B857|nr:hypothetical protein [Sporosarcina sp. HYO08]KXH87480.1 hypothetical protein AU377_02625 [Sporosarcina sp. HYO08]